MLHIYRASAGSGKTYQLTQHYIQLLFQSTKKQAHRHILAVTFTNKATSEMKLRILKELHTLSQGEQSAIRLQLMEIFGMDSNAINSKAKKILTAILHDYAYFSISTIDHFFQQIMRSFAREIQIHSNYNIELENESILEQAVDNLFLDLGMDENRQLLLWLIRFAEDRIERTENWNFRNDILQIGNEIFKESYQYKAEDIDKKIHNKVFLNVYLKKLQEIRATFENNVQKIAAEALSIITEHGLTSSDFKGRSRSPMKALDKLAQNNIEISDTFLRLCEDVQYCYAKSDSKHTIDTITYVYNSGLQQRLFQLSNIFKQDINAYNTAIIILKYINTLGIVSELTAQVKKLTNEQNTILQAYTNILLHNIIDNNDTPFVYEKMGLYVDNYMIDEFQDTSTLQWKNFRPLLENSLSIGNFNMVVGDVKQSIYRWRNSNWKLLDEEILHTFGTEQVHQKNLQTNWRSDKNIVNFNNAFFTNASHLLQDILNKSIDTQATEYPTLKAYKQKIDTAYTHVFQHTCEKSGNGYVQIHFIDNDQEEADVDNDGEVKGGWKLRSLDRLPSLVEEVQAQGYAPCDIGILVRDNQQEQEVIQKLLHYKASSIANPLYCYDIIGNKGLRIESAPSIRFIIGMLKLFLQPSDKIQQAIVNIEYTKIKPNGLIIEALQNTYLQTQAFLKEWSILFSDIENEKLSTIRHYPLYDMVESLIVLFELNKLHHEVAFVQALQDIVFDFSKTKTADLRSFLIWWEKNREKQYIPAPENQHAINIMTIHKSKGLDFKVVIIPFCDWKLNDTSKHPILWCQPTVSPFDELPLLPIAYNKKMEKSIFVEEYFEEQMNQYIDNINLAYVAFTRAKNALICMSPLPKNTNDINTISQLLVSCFQSNNSEVKNDNINLPEYYDTEKKIFAIGHLPQNIQKEQYTSLTNTITTNFYPISMSYIKKQSVATTTLPNVKETNNRDYGIYMHKILGCIKHKNDCQTIVDQFIQKGLIRPDEKAMVLENLAHFFSIPAIKDLFEADLQILNERTIISPNGEQYRPDRVMIKNEEAVVIDYKFGTTENESYLRQVENYVRLITNMGYKTIGYVYYVGLGKLQKIA